ncbi:MAG: hypothetical protein JXB10_02690 [Pirellulales bacterium]|nr:hypothetical protein [Pirellulales bacterium]
MPDPEERSDFEESQFPDDSLLGPFPDMESLGGAGLADDTAPPEETLSPDAVSPAQEAEESVEPEPVEEKGKKGKKKKKKEKKEKVKKIKASTKDSAGEEKGDKEHKKKSSAFSKNITEASPYTVMLGIAVVFLLIAVFCLIVELNRYHFDVNAKEAKDLTAMRLALDRMDSNVLRG